MKKIVYLFLGAMSLGAATPGSIVKVTNHAALGNILTDHKGMTLYTFSRDTTKESKCYKKCAKYWPPLIVTDKKLSTSLGGKLSVIDRKDNNKLQLTYDGKPLYYYKEDEVPGDAKGQGLKKEWYIVKITQ
jgi:predicted lipoprotein with Yx(FWY)xxD motif